ncbi:protein of unknown function [Clostridium beijerinckii]|nr:protein of unknown function [Clostridium beijerinckii]
MIEFISEIYVSLQLFHNYNKLLGHSNFILKEWGKYLRTIKKYIMEGLLCIQKK